jgi:hypothetical protein
MGIIIFILWIILINVFEDYFWLITASAIGIYFIYKIIQIFSEFIRKARKYDAYCSEIASLSKSKEKFEEEKNKFEIYKEAERAIIKKNKDKFEEYKKEEIKNIKQLAKEKSKGFPWLAKAYGDYFYLQDQKKASFLETKSHPAPRAAEQVREIAAQRRTAEKLYRILKYQLEYYERLFPWLVDFKAEDIDDLISQIRVLVH